MESKNFTDVIIDGKSYTLAGFEEEAYLQRVAAYINNKIGELKRKDGFLRQNTDYRVLMIYLNIADDYFKAQHRASALESGVSELDKEMYDLKHELISTQMKLETAMNDSNEWQKQLQEADDEIARLREELSRNKKKFK